MSRDLLRLGAYGLMVGFLVLQTALVWDALCDAWHNFWRERGRK